MQKNSFNKHTVTVRALPALLAILVAVSATAVAGSPLSAAPAKQTQKAAPAKAKPATPAAKPDGDKKAADSAKDAKDKAALAKEMEASFAAATAVEPLTLLQEPSQYLNKKVKFTATFNRFADIALDYKKAFRDSRDYVTFFILRPDVTASTIPLSELKLFFPRKKSTEVMELEPGDKIQIVGTEFSTALNEPWLDVEHIKIVEKTTKSERKHQLEF